MLVFGSCRKWVVADIVANVEEAFGCYGNEPVAESVGKTMDALSGSVR